MNKKEEIRKEYFDLFPDRKKEKDAEFKESLYTDWLEVQLDRLREKTQSKDAEIEVLVKVLKESDFEIEQLREALKESNLALHRMLNSYKIPELSRPVYQTIIDSNTKILQ